MMTFMSGRIHCVPVVIELKLPFEAKSCCLGNGPGAKFRAIFGFFRWKKIKNYSISAKKKMMSAIHHAAIRNLSLSKQQQQLRT
jgi:hypothetical protein